MITDPREIEIIANARQKNVADPKRSRAPFDRIFADFLADISLEGTRLLDLGAGQHDFGELARERGATVVAVDNDPAVIELGEHKGFEARQARIQDLEGERLPGPFDGVFCKFSINAFWAPDADGQRHFVDRLARLLTDDGWSWIAPWNGIPKKASLNPAEVRVVLESQAAAFVEHGYEGFYLDDELCIRYGVHGTVANNPLFVRGLPVPEPLSRCPRL